MSDSFRKNLILQVRAIDQFGAWRSLTDDDLLIKKFVKTKEDLKKLPLTMNINEVIIGDLRLFIQGLALSFEKKTGFMTNAVLDMSHEGFGKGFVITENIVVIEKYFRNAHRFGFQDLEAMDRSGEELIADGIKILEKFKPCLGTS